MSIEGLAAHYAAIWPGSDPLPLRHESAADRGLPESFRVLRFAPAGNRRRWIYATSGMATPGDSHGLELHLASPVEHDDHAGLLAAIAHLHLTGPGLGLGHTVDFGSPWFPGSACDHGLISLPYLDGPKLEEYRGPDGPVNCFWLIPITRAERKFKSLNGLEALESLFESAGLQYLAPARPSLVADDG